jgi:flagellar protein FliO/FliZ
MDFIEIGRAVGALMLILGLIGAAGLAARRYGLPGLAKPVNRRRLTLVEVLAISPRQKICIVKCDEAEHLVVVGEGGASVIVRDLPKPKPSVSSAEPTP